MKILAITPWVPGRQRPRAMRLLELMSQNHEVHCIAASWSEMESSNLFPCGLASAQTVRIGKAKAIGRALLAILKGSSLQQAFLMEPALVSKIQKTIESIQPDLVYLNVLRTAQFAHEIPDQVPIVVDLDEIRSQYYAQLRDSASNPYHRLIGVIELPRMRRAEADILHRARAVLVSSPQDVAASENVVLVRTPIFDIDADVPPQSADRAASSPPTVTMVGRMSYLANQEAVRWFLRQVWPGVRRKHPDALFRIAGVSPPAWMRRIRKSGVSVLGAVPSVEDLLRDSNVAVVPVSLATGVQMKLLEGFSVSVPVVTTPRVAELAGVHSGTCAIASSPDEWVDAVSKILDNPEYGSEMARAGRDWLLHNHGRQSVAAQLDSALFNALHVRNEERLEP